MPKARDLTGQRFNRLTAIERVSVTTSGEIIWRCVCDCGGEAKTTVTKLRSGYTGSCGCLQREATARRSFKHGDSNNGGAKPETRLYRIWNCMRRRCYDEKDISYPRYGARGVTVCDEWRKGFVPFRDWAQANGYADSLSIDRLENSKGYSPDNCRWATRKEQAANRGGRFAK